MASGKIHSLHELGELMTLAQRYPLAETDFIES